MASNKLAAEKSPYLLQHATNPVEWYPWNDEALALAKSTGKPIFLSIGYSACHWCHVMAHESFENAETAAFMNKHFINIKVDREERPDIDAIYMSAVQALTGSGGWPMSVWLTPDLKPFYGGTYFPPDDRYGRAGFPSVLTQLAEVYEKERDKVTEASEQISGALSQALTSNLVKSELPDATMTMQNTFRMLKASFDADKGGFGRAPKFPMPTYLDFLLLYHARTKDPEALQMARFSLEKMAKGGLYDQLGGGFARYSTDDNWIVPHFEKMLYDNSQLIATTVAMFQSTNDPFFADLAHDSIAYVLRDLGHKQGGFFSAEDADSEGKEGAFYVWTLAEFKQHLPADLADVAMAYYGVTANGNFFDPHTGEVGKNILVQAQAIDREQKKNDLSEIRKILFDVRAKRPRPSRDEKIITEWNGLMMSALVRAGMVLKTPAYIKAAERVARFLETALYEPKTKTLFRRWRDGDRAVAGHQIDYAMLVRGLIDLFHATCDTQWLDWATALQEVHDKRFYDEKLGGYFMTEARPDLIVRIKDDGDNVIPSGNSIAALNGLKMSVLTGRIEFQNRALESLKLFSQNLMNRPGSLTTMLAALDFDQNGRADYVREALLCKRLPSDQPL